MVDVFVVYSWAGVKRGSVWVKMLAVRKHSPLRIFIFARRRRVMTYTK